MDTTEELWAGKSMTMLCIGRIAIVLFGIERRKDCLRHSDTLSIVSRRHWRSDLGGSNGNGRRPTGNTLSHLKGPLCLDLQKGTFNSLGSPQRSFLAQCSTFSPYQYFSGSSLYSLCLFMGRSGSYDHPSPTALWHFAAVWDAFGLCWWVC